MRQSGPSPTGGEKDGETRRERRKKRRDTGGGTVSGTDTDCNWSTQPVLQGVGVGGGRGQKHVDTHVPVPECCHPHTHTHTTLHTFTLPLTLWMNSVLCMYVSLIHRPSAGVLFARGTRAQQASRGVSLSWVPSWVETLYYINTSSNQV